jgi:hypothetical protein
LRCLSPPRRGLIFSKNFDQFGLDYEIRKKHPNIKSILVTLVMSLSASRICLGVDIEVTWMKKKEIPKDIHEFYH